MAGDPQLALRLAAFSAGMSAKAGTLDMADLERLRAQAAMFDVALTLRRAIEGFALDARVHARDPVRLAELGRDLCRYIDTLNIPEPPDSQRRDIYG
ncbi:hypothetical protein SAMN05444007_108227 [Cribrihabitans marinus]|uniref:Uncharacterized protein n=1 Tax=Cribrihabitans marinus TaxID=1227549 RepID=A0A1H7CNK1_9RHOB|nr:hypothetical protein [Cribrihabitans marinus]GGH36146.1 hypothetical protein GCM10010973_29950 [Cribrihabitans marinus]SEJ91181.1 hypothetical protein SAMN05444007_108227 [Cribrihabitans marinus]